MHKGRIAFMRLLQTFKPAHHKSYCCLLVCYHSTLSFSGQLRDIYTSDWLSLLSLGRQSFSRFTGNRSCRLPEQSYTTFSRREREREKFLFIYFFMLLVVNKLTYQSVNQSNLSCVAQNHK